MDNETLNLKVIIVTILVAMAVGIVTLFAMATIACTDDSRAKTQEKINRNKLKIKVLRTEIDSLEAIKFINLKYNEV